MLAVCGGATTGFTFAGGFAAGFWLAIALAALLETAFGATDFFLAAAVLDVALLDVTLPALVLRLAAAKVLDFTFFAVFATAFERDFPAFLRLGLLLFLRATTFFFFAAEGFALARDADAALRFFVRFLAMIVAAGKGFGRASQRSALLAYSLVGLG
jgi:hypothetical protein